MAKSKAGSSGRKQNSSGGKQTRATARKAVRNPMKRKALSARTGGTKKLKGPAAKKPARAKGSPTIDRRKSPRNASKPVAKAASATNRAAAAKKPAGRSAKPAARSAKPAGRSAKAATRPAARSAKPAGRAAGSKTSPRKRRLGGVASPEPVRGGDSGMAAEPLATDVQDMEVTRQTVPPAQPEDNQSADDVMDADIDDDDVEPPDTRQDTDTDAER